MSSFSCNNKQRHANTITIEDQISMMYIFMQVCVEDLIVPTVRVVPAQGRVSAVKSQLLISSNEQQHAGIDHTQNVLVGHVTEVLCIAIQVELHPQKVSTLRSSGKHGSKPPPKTKPQPQRSQKTLQTLSTVLLRTRKLNKSLKIWKHKAPGV